jgi:hypothetical protein
MIFHFMKVFSIKCSLFIGVFRKAITKNGFTHLRPSIRRLIHPFVVARMNISTPFRTNCREILYWRVLINFVKTFSICLQSNKVTFYKKIRTFTTILVTTVNISYVYMFTNVFMVTTVNISYGYHVYQCFYGYNR